MGWYAKQQIKLDVDASSGVISRFDACGNALISSEAPSRDAVEIQVLRGDEEIVTVPHVNQVTKNGNTTVVNFDYCEVLGNDEQLAIHGDYQVEIDEEGIIHVEVSFTNDSDLTVISVLCPRSAPVKLADTMTLLYPHHAGDKVVDVPNTLATERYLNFGRAESVKTEYGYVREINYCGLASMTWMDLSDGQTGIYAASYDPTFPVTGVRVETGGPDNPWVSLSFRKYITIEPGESYTSPEVVWAVHSGDWHLSAKRYREWFEQHITQAEHPEDLAEEVILSPHYNFRRHSGIKYRFEDIPAIADADRERFDSHHFFLASYNHMGFDTRYPNYNPDIDLGTPYRLQQGMKYINDQGGFTTVYINCRIMDKYSESRDTLGEKWMLRKPDGSPIDEVYGPKETIVLCPGHPEWRTYLEEFAEWKVQAYGARGIYYDQLGSATPYPCYSGHEHSPDQKTSSFNQGYRDLIDSTTKRLKAIREDSFLMIENCGDIYSSKVWGSLVWNGTLYDEFFNLYKYTFPEHMLLTMINPRDMDNPVEQEGQFYNDLSRAFLLGAVMWLEYDVFVDNVPSEAQRERMLTAVHEVLDLRRLIAPQLAKVTFNDNVNMDLPANVQGTIWTGAKNERIGLLDNRKEQEGVITLTNLEGLTGTEQLQISLDGESWQTCKCEFAAESVTFPVPAARFSVFTFR